MTNPVGGPTSPEPVRGARGTQGADAGKFQKAMRPVEEVEKVSEVELDQQQKRPYATPPEEEGEIDENLPESEEFWENNDLPDQPIPPTQFNEQPQPLTHQQAKQQSAVPEKKTAKEFGGIFGPSTLKKPKVEIKAPSPHENFGQEKPRTPWASPIQSKESSGKKTAEKKGLPQPSLPIAPPPLMKGEKPIKAFWVERETPTVPVKKEERPAPNISQKEKTAWQEKEKIAAPSRGFTEAHKDKGDEKDSHKKQASFESQTPVSPPDPLPPAAQQVAQIAQTSASPFLTPQTAALFYQMVGTVVFMSMPKTGVSLTEVVLNSPKFQNSVFYNTTITIAKYSSAPDSFNIRLTGTPEAVKAFNQNISSLTSAFTAAYEDHRIKFRIGRLETELSPGRPLIRRKKEGGGKEDMNEREK
ncbi:MAG: hypothetical protein HW387_788 [Parachlamydiales bacterium]|nr:hypothetical protein [Parachlamydiales bacterium]